MKKSKDWMQKLRAEAKAKGLVRYGDQYITPEHRDKLRAYAKRLTEGKK